MRFPLRIPTAMLFAVIVAATPLAGCRRTVVVNDDPTYRQWESDTHREHRDPAQRTDDEKRQYNDWRRDHERH